RKLEAYDLEQQKTVQVAPGISDFRMAARGNALVLRIGNRLRVLPPGVKSEALPKGDRPGRESGWIDLDRVRVEVVPGAEWRQMFREAWRLQRDHFWTPDMSGLDWQQVHDRYLPLVDRVATRSEFSDLIWEMQGELGTSHCYELGGDYRPSPRWMQGHLGADLELDPQRGRWRIAGIPRGDSWDESRCSPLAAPGVALAPGDEILAIDGEPVGREVSPYERLVYKAKQRVELTVRSAAPARRRGGRGRRAAPAAERTVIVTTLGSEYGLRYRDWVERNRARVHAETDGRIGYVHVPNMGPVGYAEFHRYYMREVLRDGLIIDVRYNGGGHVSQLLLEKLLRRRVGYDETRWGQPEPYPSDAPAGPMVALTNEYAGSDGDIFSHCFKLYGLGPLIGKRTWGGVVGIWPRHGLIDGTITTQPEFAFWFEDVGWGVENYGTDPDIEVEIRPQDHAAGSDPQMDRAIREVERLMRRQPPNRPLFGERPRLRPAGLAPRVQDR
ncbi:MAG: PDZ domain-containing protein, partial [Candidatus Eiseniibacteriota bacterium]